MPIKPITIEPVLNGFVCNVGCSRIVFNSIQHLVSELERYIREPDKVEKEYVNNAINKIDNRLEPVQQNNLECSRQESVQSLRR